VQNNTFKESADARMILSSIQFIEKCVSASPAHIFVISQDADLLILTNQLKTFRNVRIHVMTSIIHRSFVNGLADIVVYYERAFPKPKVPEYTMHVSPKRPFKEIDQEDTESTPNKRLQN
jgi:hypothetical protein